MPQAYETYLQRVRDQLAAERQKALDTSNKMYENQKNYANEEYNSQIKETKAQYDEAYRNNAVQKAVNERQIAETMASMGLTDSGLNRTQITANQLSYANQRGNIDRNLQKAVDSLALALRKSTTEIENNRLAAENNINQNYENTAATQATSLYNADAQKEAEEAKAYYSYLSNYQNSEKGQGIISVDGGLLSRNYAGSLRDNGVQTIYNNNGTTTYVDTNTGKKTTLDKNINPYTGTRNKNVANGTFSNGYQPNNLGKDKNGKVIKLTQDEGFMDLYGIHQNVFKAGGKSYVWATTLNDYIQAFKVGNDWNISKYDAERIARTKRS